MPRHALDPDEPAAPTTRLVLRVADAVIPKLVEGWLWFGRALIFAVVVVLVLCRITGVADAGLPADGSPGPLLPNVATALCLALGLLSPLILLPHAFTRTVERDGDLLTARTVLGPRAVDISTARAFTWSIPTNTGSTDFLVIVGRPSGLLILGTDGRNRRGQSLDRLVAGLAEPRAWARSARGWLGRILATVIIPNLVVGAFVVLVILVTMAIAVGG